MRTFRKRSREHLVTVVTAGLIAGFGVVLVTVLDLVRTAARVESAGFLPPAVTDVLPILGTTFFLVAVYVAAIVAVNTTSMIVAGRRREIALLRLLGATATRVRGRVLLEGTVAAVIGAAAGVVTGLVLIAGSVAIATASGFLPAADYRIVSVVAWLPALAIVAATAPASWRGARLVAAVSPIEATGAALSPTRRRGSDRAWLPVSLMAFGFFLLFLGAIAGAATPLGLFVAFTGGAVSFSGLVLGADRFVGPVLRTAARLVGTSPVGQLAVGAQIRDRQRFGRSVIGLTIGITLVVMLAVATATFESTIAGEVAIDPSDREVFDAIAQTLSQAAAIMLGLVAFSGVIATVGLVSTISLGVTQRIREFALLRIIGADTAQVRRIVMAESALVVAAALVGGTLLGLAYGWAGSQSVLGSVTETRIIGPVVPWELLALMPVVAVLVATAAALVPARRVTRVSPVEALAVR